MKFLLSFILLLGSLSAQNFKEDASIGKFRDAGAFFISPSGFIYVTDPGSNKVFKLDTLGRVLKETGGYGWEEGAFDYPADIFATSLNVYVADKNNHRIQWFDKDLNFLSSLATRNNQDERMRFGYPLSAAVNTQGDLFILDSENNRVLKFDMFGSLLIDFGGVDAGKYRLGNPLSLALFYDYCYVLDNRGRRIVVFDQFGNGINILDLNERAENICASGDNIFVISSHSVYYLDQVTGDLKKIAIVTDREYEARDFQVFQGKFYMLTPETIFIFSRE